MIDHPAILQRLTELQRAIRDVVIRSRDSNALHAVDRSTSADTIYRIDTLVEPIVEAHCVEWSKTTPLVLIAEGIEGDDRREGVKVFPRGSRDDDAAIRVIIDPIDGTRGLMYDKRSAWSLAGVAPNHGAQTSLRDIEISVMTELPTSKMGFGDVLWAVKRQGAQGVRETLIPDASRGDLRGMPLGRILYKTGRVTHANVVEALDYQKLNGGRIGEVLVKLGMAEQADIDFALMVQQGTSLPSKPLALVPSSAETINHGFATVSNFFPGTKVLASELMERIARELIGPADVSRATVFDDQYISTAGQWYELIVGHDRFNADLRPVFYRMNKLPEGMCCHPYDCAALLIAEEAGVIITDATGQPLNGPLDCTTGISWAGYANQTLRNKIEPIVRAFIA